jgi:hypothetical protein
VRFQVLVVKIMKMTCRSLCRVIGKKLTDFLEVLTASIIREMRCASVSTRLHDATSQKTALVMLTSLRTWNFTKIPRFEHTGITEQFFTHHIGRSCTNTIQSSIVVQQWVSTMGLGVPQFAKNAADRHEQVRKISSLMWISRTNPCSFWQSYVNGKYSVVHKVTTGL